MKKILLTESEKKAIIVERENTIISSFNKIFNSIKRIDENELALHDDNDITRNADGGMYLNDFIKITSKTIGSIIRPQIHCLDGTKLSVQASHGHYCRPRQDKLPFYSAVEVGYPTTVEDELLPYMEEMGSDDPLECVYPFTPIDVVDRVIKKHGGIDVNKTIHGWLKSRNGYVKKNIDNSSELTSIGNDIDEASVDQTGGIHGLSGDFIDDDLPQYLDQFDTSSGMMDLKDLEATRNKAYQRNPYAAEIADFANQYNKKLRMLYKAYIITHDKISYAQFVL